MKKITSAAIAAISGLAATLTPLAPANAGDGYWHDDWRHDRHVVLRRHHNNNDALVGGLIGLTAGLIIMDAINNQPRPVYRPAPQVYDYPPAPRVKVRKVVRYVRSLEPWSDEWYRYCSQRYQSFNPETGTYRGYDGRNHFCSAN